MTRDYKKEYENYHSKPAQKKRRAQRNASRRKAVEEGLVRKGDGKDVHHRDGNPMNTSLGNLQVMSQSKNRSFARTKTARKKK
jgi:hypothetical protein